MKRYSLISFFSACIAILFSSCKRLDSIDHSPKISPAEFLNDQPWTHVHLGSLDFIWTQPLSTCIVYFVGLFSIYSGYRFLSSHQDQRSKMAWGIGLILSGIGALFAGTSYQAFGYEIKCNGKEFCSWTSWWEIAYMMITVPGMCAMLIASAYSNTMGKLRKGLIFYAFFNSTLYTLLLIYGVFASIKFLLSFEFLSLASSPGIIVLIILHYRSYRKERSQLNLSLFNAWLLLIAVMITYTLYSYSGLTQKLWAHRIWFSDNDVLHVGMILWVYYVQRKLLPIMRDLADYKT